MFRHNLSNLMSLRSNLISSCPAISTRLSLKWATLHQAFMEDLRLMQLADVDRRIKIERAMLYEQNYLKKNAYRIKNVDFGFMSSRSDIENQIMMLEQSRSQLYMKLEAAHFQMMLKASSFGSSQEDALDGKIAGHIHKVKERLLKTRKQIRFLYGKLPDRKKYQVASYLAGGIEERPHKSKNGYLRANRRQAHW